MNVRTRFLIAVLGSAALLVARPAVALFDVFNPLDLQVKLTQAVLCDGSVRLAPGTYDAHLTTSADGAVRAGFFQGGVKKGEARGIIAVRKAGSEKKHTFKSLGFSSSSPQTFKLDGRRLALEIGSPGSNQMFIRFELPPVPRQ